VQRPPDYSGNGHGFTIDGPKQVLAMRCRRWPVSSDRPMALPVRDLRMVPALPTAPVAASDPFPPLCVRSLRLIVLRGVMGSIAAITVDLTTPGTVAPAFFAAAAWTDGRRS
jgi:hypothetical protein